MRAAVEVTTALLVIYWPVVLALLVIATLIAVEWIRDSLSPEPARPAVQAPAAVNRRVVPLLISRLREADLFEGLTDSELSQVVNIGAWRTVPAGERFGLNGDRDSVFTVLRGELILATKATGKGVAIRRAYPRETVPISSLLEDTPLVTAITAAADSELFEIPRAGLEELCEREPMLGLQVYRAAAHGLERRYRTTLTELVGSLRSALDMASLAANEGAVEETPVPVGVAAVPATEVEVPVS